jgi:hypothetical protein
MRRNFGFSQKRLKEKAVQLIAVCKRDFFVLASEGHFEENTLRELEKLTAEFSSASTDRDNLREINALNLRVKEIKRRIIKTIRIIQCRLEADGHKDNEYFKMLKTLKVHNTDSEVFISGIRRIQALSPNFYSLGVPASLTGSLNGMISEYKKTLDSFNNAVRSRKKKSENRIAVANRLTNLISQICRIGKIVFKDTEKYKEYMMYFQNLICCNPPEPRCTSPS